MTKFKVSFVGAIAAVFALVASSSADAAYMHSVTLKMGSRNAQVMELQKALNATSCKVAASGVGSAGMESMYFGAMTKAAVQCFQAANGLGADGVVGPMTGAKLAAAGSTTGGSTSGGSTTGGSTSGAVLQGSVGSVDDWTLVSSLNNEEVGEDSNDVKVAGLEIEADDSSDIKITAIKLVFVNSTGGNSSDDFEDVADSVSIWFGSTKVAELDADEFNDDNDYSKTVALTSDAIIKADKTGTFYVAVSGASNLDSDDEGAEWTVDFNSVRFVDAQGAVITNDPGTAARTFSFETFSTANDVELAVSLNSDEDDINDARTITVDDQDDTDDVAILAFTLEAEGDSDVNISEIPVLFTTSTADIGNVISSVSLYHGSTEVASEDIDGGASTELVTFEDLDIDVDAGDEEEFWVKVNILGLDEFITPGTTIKAELSGTQVDAIEAEDESGEDLGANELTGTAVGEAHGLYEDGISLATGAVTAMRETVDGANNDYGSFTIKFSVTAIGTDVYLDKTFASSTATASSEAEVEDSSGNDLTNYSAVILSSTDSDATEETNSFRIREGKTADFTLNLASSVNPDTSIRAVLYNLAWGTSDGTATANSYSFDMGTNGNFKTNYVLVQD